MSSVRIYAALALLVGAVGVSRAQEAPRVAGATQVVPVQDRRFDIQEFQVLGNSVLTPREIQEVLQFFVGEQRKAEDVDGARAALEKLYKELGYRTVTVTIPKQTIRDGIIKLQVSETAIGDTRIEGARYSSAQGLRLEVPSLQAGTVPNFNELQRELLYANRIASRRVTPELAPGQVPGTLDITLKVDESLPLGASLGLNNDHARGTTALRSYVSAYYGNLFQRGNTLSLFYSTAPSRSDDGRILSASYALHLGDSPWTLTLSDLQSNSRIEVAQGILAISDSNTIGLRLSRPLTVESQDWFPSITLGADYKNFDSQTVLSSAQGSKTELTPLRYLPLSVSLSQSYRGTHHRLQSDAALIMSTGAVGSDEQQLDLSRYGARAQSVYLRASLSDYISLPKGFGINLRALGQFTDRPLLPAEKLSGGGTDSVRGYFEAEVTGDYGAVGNLELRLPSLPDLFAAAGWAAYLTELQPYGFFDAAWLHDHGPYVDASSPRIFRLMSTGGGLSLRMREYANLQLVYSEALRSLPFVKSDPNSNTPSGLAAPTAKGDRRLLFRFVGSF